MNIRIATGEVPDVFVSMSAKSLDILEEIARQENSAYALLNRLNFLSNLLNFSDLKIKLRIIVR